jgi:hypothetical protein
MAGDMIGARLVVAMFFDALARDNGKLTESRHVGDACVEVHNALVNAKALNGRPMFTAPEILAAMDALAVNGWSEFGLVDEGVPE